MPRIREVETRPVRSLPNRRARPLFSVLNPGRVLGSPRASSTPRSQQGTPTRVQRTADMSLASDMRRRLGNNRTPLRRTGDSSRRRLDLEDRSTRSSESEMEEDTENDAESEPADDNSSEDEENEAENDSSEDNENEAENDSSEDEEAENEQASDEPMDSSGPSDQEDMDQEISETDGNESVSEGSHDEPEGTPERKTQKLKRKLRYHQMEYEVFLKMYKEIRKKRELPENQDNKSKRKLYRMTLKTKEGMETHFDDGEKVCRKLGILITSRGRLHHEEAISDLEEWIQEAEGLLGNSSIVSQLDNSSLSIPISQDRGTIVLGTVKGDIEMEDIPMPPGWFDPPVTDKSELEEFRRNKDKIELFVFDGSSESASWETWWAYFREAIHKYPEEVCHTFRKLKYLHKYVQGVPRIESGLDNPELFQHVSNYAACVQSLHQVYGKQTMNFGDMSKLIANYVPEGKERMHFLAFLSNLYMYAQRFVAIGAAPEYAYQHATSRILECLPEERRRYMLDSFTNKHNEFTPNQKKFMDYKYFLNTYYGDMAQKILPHNSKEISKGSEEGKKAFKRKGDFDKNEETGKKKKEEGKKNWKPFKKSVFITCRLHYGKRVAHSALECNLPAQLKEKLCKKAKICAVCQHEGHQSEKCPHKKVLALLTTQHQGEKDNSQQGGKDKSRKKKNKKKGDSSVKKEETEKPTSSGNTASQTA